MTTCCAQPEENGCTCCPVHGKQPVQSPVPYVPVYIPVYPASPYWWSPSLPSLPYQVWTSTSSTSTNQVSVTYNTSSAA